MALLDTNRPGLTITPAAGDLIVQAVNNARRRTVPPAADMQVVKWDAELASDLKKFAERVGGGWFFAPRGYDGGKNGFDVMLYPEFKTKYPDYYYMLHDCTQSKKPYATLGIIKFRLRQKPCFDYNNCQTKGHTGYRTCYASQRPKGVNCNWVMQYYPVLTQSNLSKMACVPLDYPGEGSKRDMTFWCYGRYKKTANRLESTDQPYLSGEPCSKCPEDMPICVQGLCSPTA